MIGEVGQVAQDPHFCYLPELGYKLEHFSNGGVTGGNVVRLKGVQIQREWAKMRLC